MLVFDDLYESFIEDELNFIELIFDLVFLVG